MRVAGNKLKHILDFFEQELKDIYPSSEISAMSDLAIEHVLGFSKKEIQDKKEENLNQSDLLKLYDCAKDLKKQIPLHYILGEAWFYNLKFKVDKNVLIPRPETEELVDLILKDNRELSSLIDMGTGSGCIPISIKKNRKHADVYACDISMEALEVAKKNAELNETEISFFEANILDQNEVVKKAKRKFEVIVSNPPYIMSPEKAQMEENVLSHEPHLALFVEGEDAIIFYKKIIDLCNTSLNEKGKLYFELNPLTAKDVKDYADASGYFSETILIKDMSGALRFFKGLKK